MIGRAAIHSPAASGKESLSVLGRGSAGNGVPQESWTDPAGDLFLILVSEIAGNIRESSKAWISTRSTPDDEIVSQWASYQDRVAAALQGAPLSLSQLRHLASSAPEGAPASFAAFTSIIAESDPELFFGDLMNLGQQLHQSRHLPIFTEGLLSWCSTHSATEAEANQLLTVRTGGGGFAAQLEYQGSHLIQELVNPLFLVPFGMATLSARGASLAVLSRSTRWSGPTLLASETAAWVAEVPALVLSRRLGLQMFAGGSDLWDSGSISHEILATAGPFALLRGTSNGFHLLQPSLRNVAGVMRSSGEITSLGGALMGTTRFSAEVGAVMGGHYLNHVVGVEALPSGASQLFFSSLLTVGHMRIAGGIVERLNPLRIGAAISTEQTRLRSRTIQDFYGSLGVERSHALRPRLEGELALARGRLPMGDLTLSKWVSRLESNRTEGLSEAMENHAMPLHALLVRPSRRDGKIFSQLENLAWQTVTATGPQAAPRRFGPQLMMMTGDTPAGSGRGGSRSSEPPSSDSSARDLVAEEISRRVTEITAEATNDNSNTRLQNAAAKLSGLWAKYVRNPQEAPLQEIDTELEIVREELQAAKSSGTKLQSLLQQLGIFVEQLRSQQKGAEPSSSQAVESGTPETLIPEEAPNSFRRYLWNPVGRVLVGFRDLIKGRSESRETSESQPPRPPESTEEKPLDLDAIAEEIAKKEAQGQNFEGAAKLLARLRTHLYFISKSKGPDSRWQRGLNDILEQLTHYFPNLNWPRLGMADLTDIEIQPGQEGALLGMAVRADWLNTDSPLASRLRGGETSPVHGDNRELELLHQSILFGAHYNGPLKRFNRAIDPLVTEYGASENQAAAMRLTGEAVAQLMRNRWSLENLLEQLRSSATGGPLEGSLRSIEVMLPREMETNGVLTYFGNRNSAENFFLTGLYLSLRSEGGAINFNRQILPEAVQYEGMGFHPSIAISLFGAARGRAELFPELFSKNFDPAAFLERARIESQMDGE